MRLVVGLIDLGLIDADQVIPALVGDLDAPPSDPVAHPFTGAYGVLPTNLSGGLKARGHPVGGTGLFQIAENYLQMTDRFPNRSAQVSSATFGISNSIGGPGNNNYVTLLESTGSRRRRETAPTPRLHFESPVRRPERETAEELHGANAIVEGATPIHVTSGGGPPLHVALLRVGAPVVGDSSVAVRPNTYLLRFEVSRERRHQDLLLPPLGAGGRRLRQLSQQLSPQQRRRLRRLR